MHRHLILLGKAAFALCIVAILTTAAIWMLSDAPREHRTTAMLSRMGG